MAGVLRHSERTSVVPSGEARFPCPARDGGVVSRADLLQEVWGYDRAVVSRTVDTHIGELRRKLEDDPANPRHILTVHKVGYKLTSGESLANN